MWVSNDYDRMKLSIAFVFLACTAFAQLRPDGATASFKGSLPPKPTAALSAEQQGAIDKRLAEVPAQFPAFLLDKSDAADEKKGVDCVVRCKPNTNTKFIIHTYSIESINVQTDHTHISIVNQL